jgi:hypothetical protein
MRHDSSVGMLNYRLDDRETEVFSSLQHLLSNGYQKLSTSISIWGGGEPFSILLVLPTAAWLGESSASKRIEYQKMFLGI